MESSGIAPWMMKQCCGISPLSLSYFWSLLLMNSFVIQWPTCWSTPWSYEQLTAEQSVSWLCNFKHLILHQPSQFQSPSYNHLDYTIVAFFIYTFVLYCAAHTYNLFPLYYRTLLNKHLKHVKMLYRWCKAYINLKLVGKTVITATVHYGWNTSKRQLLIRWQIHLSIRFQDWTVTKWGISVFASLKEKEKEKVGLEWLFSGTIHAWVHESLPLYHI